MTQDERKQKALEAAIEAASSDDSCRLRHYTPDEAYARQVGAGARAYHAAMTEGGVWISREDAAFIADSLETTAPLIAKVCTPEGFTAKERSLSIAARIRAKLEGNHDA